MTVGEVEPFARSETTMTKTRPLLAFLFVATGSIAAILGYRVGRLGRHPVAVGVACALFLAGLGGWYVRTRHADERFALRSQQGLALIIVGLTLLGGAVLRALRP